MSNESAQWRRIHILVSGRADCRADLAPYVNPLRDLVEWLEVEAKLDPKIHLMVELRANLTLQLKDDLFASYKRLRVAWGSRVEQWRVDADPALSSEQRGKDHPFFRTYRPCGWGKVENTMSQLYKIHKLYTGIQHHMPNDLFLYVRPNSVLDLRSTWYTAMRRLDGGVCHVLSTNVERNGALNDNFALMDLTGASQYAAAYRNMHKNMGGSCVSAERLAATNVLSVGGMKDECQLPFAMFPRVCLSIPEVSMLLGATTMRERLVGNSPNTWPGHNGPDVVKKVR